MIDQAQQDAWKVEALAIDKEDLIGLLNLRFGDLPAGIVEQIQAMTNGDTLERLILVAANVPTWEGFLAELNADGPSFRIVGEQYHPV